MKAILMSIKPQHVANILNGLKTIEIRKKFPSDYVGWVYIYCTKARPYLTRGVRGDVYPSCVSSQGIVPHHLNSRVVAVFWCDKVEEISIDYSPTYETGKWASHYEYRTNSMYDCDLKEKSCLSFKELDDYLLGGNGYAIHITNLEIFEKPKEIGEFYKLGAWEVYEEQLDSSYMKRTEQEIMKSLGQVLTRAPQSFCFVEIE